MLGVNTLKPKLQNKEQIKQVYNLSLFPYLLQIAMDFYKDCIKTILQYIYKNLCKQMKAIQQKALNEQTFILVERNILTAY